jgi:hypothetical protein
MAAARPVCSLGRIQATKYRPQQPIWATKRWGSAAKRRSQVRRQGYCPFSVSRGRSCGSSELTERLSSPKSVLAAPRLRGRAFHWQPVRST